MTKPRLRSDPAVYERRAKAHGTAGFVKRPAAPAGRALGRLSAPPESVYSGPMTVITDSSALADFCRRMSTEVFVTVDTEFMRDRTYWPDLCLVQIAGAEEAAAIDPMADGIDLAPMFELLANPQVLKVFHAARQDIEIFFLQGGRLPAPIFDSQVAAMVCGFGDSRSEETLAAKLAGAHVDKTSRFTDWARRPLTERQLQYALGDVVHLRRVYERLSQRLEAT